MGFPKPSRWVIEEYLPDYIRWVSASPDPKKATAQTNTSLSGGNTMDVGGEAEQAAVGHDWSTLLRVDPELDYYVRLEKEVYGECLALQEQPLPLVQLAAYVDRRHKLEQIV